MPTRLLRVLLRRAACLLIGCSVLFSSASGIAARRAERRSEAPIGLLPLSETSWLTDGLLKGKPYELMPEPWVGLLERYLVPWRNRTPEWRAFYRGAYGPSRRAWLPDLCWSRDRCEPQTPVVFSEGPGPFARLSVPMALNAPAAMEASWTLPPRLSSPEPEALGVRRRKPCPRWKAPRPVTVLRYAGEGQTLAFTDCEGVLASSAVEGLSVLARPPGTARPELPLPFEPQGEGGEWAPSVRLLHPRLVWAVSELARAFPRHAIVVMSGYRPDGHSGKHKTGQALDLYVQGITNEELFAVCRTLPDVGCGYYPNNRFVHVDVRPFGVGRVAWVDASNPGEPSRYVNGWPGVLRETRASSIE